MFQIYTLKGPAPTASPRRPVLPSAQSVASGTTQLALGSLVLFQLGLDSPHQSTSP